jgi:hypothetical protein
MRPKPQHGTTPASHAGVALTPALVLGFARRSEQHLAAAVRLLAEAAATTGPGYDRASRRYPDGPAAMLK